MVIKGGRVYMMFNIKKAKGQGALEYLLLIGGAVLIAVIVIALLVGMGSSSRQSAQTQGSNASNILGAPQAASIVSVTPTFDCNTSSTATPVLVTFQTATTGGSNTLTLYNYNAGTGAYTSIGTSTTTSGTGPYTMTATMTITANTCGTTRYAKITTVKNGSTVKSEEYPFVW